MRSVDWQLLALLLAIELAAAVVIVLATEGLVSAPPATFGLADLTPPACDWWDRRAGLCLGLTEVER